MPLDQQPHLRKAVLYRMATPDHVCPFGLKAKALLERHGYEVEDHELTSEDTTRAFREMHRVTTTPQIWIGGERIGGYDNLRAYVGDPVPATDAVSYRPVVATFAVAALMSLAARWAADSVTFTGWAMWFVGFAMILLGLQKLQDVEKFSTTFLGYDLLARKWVGYAYVYPYAETAAGLLMITGVLLWVSIPIMLFIGLIGAISVYQAVWVEKRDLKCACVGGSNNVPLGGVSLVENLMMVGMAIWMLAMI